jgi:hypothetical protein
MTLDRGTLGWAQWARLLYLTAIGLFVVTVIIGILNGLDIVEFPRDTLLTHVHAGTVGWITLGIVASAFWLFRAADARLAIALAALVPLYAAAFYTGNLPARAITGTALLLAIAWLIVWTWQTYLAGERSLPRLGVALGLTTFTYGSIIGVLLQIQFATGNGWLSGDAVGAHAAAMVFAYVVLSTMALIEWRLLGTTDLPRGGLVQFGALFLGGLILSVGLLVGAGQAAGGLYLLTQLVAVVLFVGRVIPRVLRIGWMDGGADRAAGGASLWVIVALGLFMYVVSLFVTTPDVSAIPTGVLVASDHAVFIGVVTNLLFGVIARFGSSVPDRFAAAAHGVFWGLNAGLAVFLVGLIVESPELKRIGSPVMGIAILVGLAALALRLWPMRPEDAPQAVGETV